jgi:hypothetical protein
MNRKLIPKFKATSSFKYSAILDYFSSAVSNPRFFFLPALFLYKKVKKSLIGGTLNTSLVNRIKAKRIANQNQNSNFKLVGTLTKNPRYMKVVVSRVKIM